ncbi:MAG: hypothetical protein ACOCXI_17300 [Chloroflexota bacterium]
MGYDARGSWYRWNKKQTVEDSLTLSTKPLTKGLNRVMDAAERRGTIWGGILEWSLRSTGETTSSIGYTIERGDAGPLLRLRYTTTRRGEEQKLDYRVATTYTEPNFGGRRWWFLCPLVVDGQPCRRRVGKLYLPPGAHYFGCRQCHDLTYESTRQNDMLDGVDRRLWAVLRKLKHKGSVLDPLPDKPKGMHWSTYSSLAREYMHLQELRNAAFVYEVAKIIEGGPDADQGLPLPPLDEAKEDLDWLWEEYQKHPDRSYFSPEEYRRIALRALQEDEETDEKPKRATLGQLARQAGVPYDFAKEAQAHDLIRPDGGRGKRRKRYRRKLAGWLEKLHLLRNSGYSWEELQAWTRRRFRPGHEHEVRWPEGFEVPE